MAVIRNELSRFASVPRMTIDLPMNAPKSICVFGAARISIVFDSAGYVYAVNPAGTITEYAPGGTTVVATFTGTNYGHPFVGSHAFATFCQ